MTFPKYKDVDLALLVELVRAGRPMEPQETYEPVTRHFPQLTPEDLAELRKDGRTRVWTNMIHWARDHLRVQGLLDDSVRGSWQATNEAQSALLERLTEVGIRDPAAFLNSESTLPDRLGSGWAGVLRSRRSLPTQATQPKTQPPVTPPPVGAEPELTELVRKDKEATRRLLIERLQGMDEYEFENLVGKILDALGFRNTRVVGRSGDGGVDVTCEMRNPLLSATVAVQVKRQLSNVGPKEISYLRDRWGRRMDKLLFITTSDYTGGAREVAEDSDSRPVVLVNGESLASLMIANRIGVTSQPVEALALDDEFFES